MRVSETFPSAMKAEEVLQSVARWSANEAVSWGKPVEEVHVSIDEYNVRVDLVFSDAPNAPGQGTLV